MKSRERSPDFRVSANGADLGAAWKTTSKGDDAAASMTLEATSFGEPVKAALAPIEGVHTRV